MSQQTLAEIAKAIMAKGKGILASDESSGSIKKLFDKIAVDDTPENHRRYRELLYTTADIEQHISAAIMFDETIRQSTSGGILFSEYLAAKGIVPGIKVDVGLKELPEYPGEKFPKWDDTLDVRFKDYYQLGARFSKWRTEINIGDKIPSDSCIEQSCEVLAQYSKISQANGIVPIPEPEVMIAGTHTIEMSYNASAKTLKTLFSKFKEEGVDLTGLILKTNFVMPGLSGQKVSPEVVAEKTLQCFLENIPVEVAGIVFISGGQTEIEACLNLNAVEKLAAQKNLPWKLTFSYGRALQASTLKNWLGKEENLSKAQEIFSHRVKMAGMASSGEYSIEME